MDDPRLTPARPDLAARFLDGRIKAARYADGQDFEIVDALAPLREAASSDAMLLTQALKGERVTIYDRDHEGWAWGQLNRDGYVGWLPDRALAKPGAALTHQVTSLRTFAFPGPSIKLPPIETLVMGGAVTVIRQTGGFAVTREGWYLPAQHLGSLAHRAADFVAVAEAFVGTPYLWGGRSSLGIDCSGLVQLALQASGRDCPRDSDMQLKSLGEAVDEAQQEALHETLGCGEVSRLARGDLIFWNGHVAIVRDAASLVHANAHHMATAIEAIRDAVSRIRQSGSEIVAIKRLT
jgi:cell wall-associated NlpC family hydrolase